MVKIKLVSYILEEEPAISEGEKQQIKFLEKDFKRLKIRDTDSLFQISNLNQLSPEGKKNANMTNLSPSDQDMILKSSVYNFKQEKEIKKDILEENKKSNDENNNLNSKSVLLESKYFYKEKLSKFLYLMKIKLKH